MRLNTATMNLAVQPLFELSLAKALIANTARVHQIKIPSCVIRRCGNYTSKTSKSQEITYNVKSEAFPKDDALPRSLRNYLTHLLTQNSKVLHYIFDYNLPKTFRNKMAKALFNDDTAWSKGIPKLNLDLLMGKPHSYSSNIPKWSRYQLAVWDFANTTPNVDQSDMCVLSLAYVKETPWDSKDFPLLCQIPEECNRAINFGTNFGYGLSHRLLLLLLARLSRGCAIFSIDQDAVIRNTFCEIMYREAEYIASNDFELADLMLEQMTLCSLDGHAQFLRKSWLFHLLRYQTSWGCFNITLPTSPMKRFLLTNNWSRNLFDDECGEHITAVAAGALSAAIRLILENY